MIVSVVVGFLLAGLYAISVHRWVFNPSREISKASRGGLILSAFLRFFLVASIFFLLLKVPILNMTIVSLTFISVMTLYLFNLVRKAMMSTIKTDAVRSQGR